MLIVSFLSGSTATAGVRGAPRRCLVVFKRFFRCAPRFVFFHSTGEIQPCVFAMEIPRGTVIGPSRLLGRRIGAKIVNFLVVSDLCLPWAYVGSGIGEVHHPLVARLIISRPLSVPHVLGVRNHAEVFPPVIQPVPVDVIHHQAGRRLHKKPMHCEKNDTTVREVHRSDRIGFFAHFRRIPVVTRQLIQVSSADQRGSTAD